MAVKLYFEFATKCTGYNEDYEEFYYDTEDYEYELSSEQLTKIVVMFFEDYYSLNHEQAVSIVDDFEDEILDYFYSEITELGEELFYDEAYDEWRNSKFDY